MIKMDPSLLWQYLHTGDLAGFVIACYTQLIHQMFYVVVLLMLMVPIYIRSQSITYVAILWILFASVLIPLFPAVAWPLGYVLLAMGVGVLLYRAVR